MNMIEVNTQKTAPGFWTRLAHAIAEASESHEERLERRIGRLEAEVERLSAMQRKVAKS